MSCPAYNSKDFLRRKTQKTHCTQHQTADRLLQLVNKVELLAAQKSVISLSRPKMELKELGGPTLTPI